MQIQSIQAGSYLNQNKQPQFKSVYPVVFWVAEKGGSYAPVITRDFSKTLATKFVNILNYSRKEINDMMVKIENTRQETGLTNYNGLRKLKLEIAQRVKNFISRFDADYAKQNKSYNIRPHTRAFTTSGGLVNGRYLPTAYLITGEDAYFFDRTYGRPIGVSRSRGGNRFKSAELERALADFWTQGFNYVKNGAKNFKINGEPSELHVKVDTIRARTGNIKGYNVTGVGFFPQEGAKNPFELTEWLKR